MLRLVTIVDMHSLEYEKLELVDDASTCRCCKVDDCEDGISLEQIQFPAYRNIVSGICWAKSTVRGVIDSMIPRDPVTGRLWALPPPVWDIHEIVSLKNESDAAARALFKRTLKYATFWSVYDVVALHEAGLINEADRLRKKTVEYARWNIHDLFILNDAELHATAWWLCSKTLRHATVWRTDDIISLQEAGMKCEARSLFDRTLINAGWDVQEIIALHVKGPTRSAAQLFGTTLKYASLNRVDDDIGNLQAAGLHSSACKLLNQHKQRKSNNTRKNIFQLLTY